jgi:hypothetical protein
MEGVVKHVSTHEHPSFLQMFFDMRNGPFNVHKRDDLQTKHRYSIRRFWNNVTFAFFATKFEERYWEFGRKVIKKHNWEALVIVVNAHFPIDV